MVDSRFERLAISAQPLILIHGFIHLQLSRTEQKEEDLSNTKICRLQIECLSDKLLESSKDRFGFHSNDQQCLRCSTFGCDLDWNH